MTLFEFCTWFKYHGDSEPVRVFCGELLNYPDFDWNVSDRCHLMNQLNSRIPSYANINPVLFSVFWEIYSKSAFATADCTK